MPSKDLLGGTIKEIIEAEMDEHLGYEAYALSDNTDSKNRYKPKQIRSKYWLSVLNELKNRGVKDILILCADRLTGIKERLVQLFQTRNINTTSYIR